MRLAQLFSSGIEALLNKLITLDPSSHNKLGKLKGKSLLVKIKEVDWPLLFQFSDTVSVKLLRNEETQALNTNCRIELGLATLPKLQNSSLLSQLIQQEELMLNGDIYVAQSFSNLLQELDIDWEEQLSLYTGDAFAHQAFQTSKMLVADSKDTLLQTRDFLAQRLTQQDALGVKPQDMATFSDDVNNLRSATERLSARLAILEKKFRV